MRIANSLFERIADFLEEHAPFQYMNKADLLEIAKLIRIKFHEKDEIIFDAGKIRKKQFFIINKGSVNVTNPAASKRSLTDTRYVGDLLGVGHLFDPGGCYIHSATTAEDTILYSIPWEPFEKILPFYPDVARFLKANISLRSDLDLPTIAGVTGFSHTDPLSDTLVDRIEEITQLSEYARDRLVHCGPHETMQEVAFKMLNTKSEAIVVVNHDHYPLGIVTKTDMARAIQSGRSPAQATAEDFMSSPVITVKDNPTLGNCLRIMMKSGYQHICLTENGTDQSPTSGLISERDLMLYYGNNPMVIIRQIGEINRFEELSHMRHRADMLILHELRSAEGIEWFSDVVHDLNRAFVKKVIRLSMDSLREEGVYMPQASFCLIFAGAGGRRELFTRHAMDRGVMWLADHEKDHAYCEEYFSKLSELIHEGLLKCGWTKNLEGFTESNPKWCKPISEWKSYFEGWITEGKGIELFENLRWFDMLPADGYEKLAEETRGHIQQLIKDHPSFVKRLAQTVLENAPTSEDFEKFSPKGPKQYTHFFDLYGKVCMPLVNMARLLTFAHNLPFRNTTYERFKALAEADPKNRHIYDEAAEGFRISLFIVSRSGLRDQNPGNLVHPKELSSLEVQLAKSTFRNVLSLQNFIESQYC